GFEHQGLKVDELRAALGPNLVVAGNPTNPPGRTAPVALLPLLQGPPPTAYSVVVEPTYDGGTATALIALGLDQVRDRQGAPVAIGNLQPDLIQFFPPLAQHLQDNPTLAPAYREEVLPNGDTRVIDPAADARVRLRVVDVKLS